MTDREVLKKAISTYGTHLQKVVAIEEMSELTKKICKDLREIGVYPYPNKEALLEEIVDVSIMLKQLKMIYGISDEEYQNVYNQKIERLKERLENDR